MNLPTSINTNTPTTITTYEQAISFYMMASYIYYQFPWYPSLMPDENYDRMCKMLLDLPDEVEHPHKQYIDKESLKAGTGFAIKEYPLIVQHTAIKLVREIEQDVAH